MALPYCWKTTCSVVGRRTVGSVEAAIADFCSWVREVGAGDWKGDCHVYPSSDSASSCFFRRAGLFFTFLEVNFLLTRLNLWECASFIGVLLLESPMGWLYDFSCWQKSLFYYWWCEIFYFILWVTGANN